LNGRTHCPLWTAGVESPAGRAGRHEGGGPPAGIGARIAMSRIHIVLLAAAGLAALLSTWGGIADWTEAVIRQESIRPRKVVYWTSSGSPEVDLKRARQFEQRHPNISVDPNFRETGGLQDILFVSFLSGNPPDYMDAKVHELRKYVLMGGIYPLDDMLAEENERLLEKETAERLEQWREQYSEEHGEAPPAEQVEAKRRSIRRQLTASGENLYYRQYFIGKARIHRFRVNPDDRFLRDMESHPKEAARLLAMHGKAIGIRGIAMPKTLTYNKRLFREAAQRLPQYRDVLLDADGEPRPPTTWLELHETARILTEYGRQLAADRGLPEPPVYGIVIQGQRRYDLMRGIKPLARRAGSMAFDFAGDTRTVHRHFSDTPAGRKARETYAGDRIGHFDYTHPSRLAAFALLLKLKQDDFVLPGTASRHYEDARTALASGRAAMLLDGWHAALIGAERVPWAAQDLGSAPIPVPYHRVDADAGWTAERIEQEKRRLHELLELDELGLELPPGNKLPRTAEDSVQFLTSLVRHPQATWTWLHFEDRNEDILKAECRRGTCPTRRLAMKHIGAPDEHEWFPYPYQLQVYDIIANHCQMWPEAPLHGALKPPAERDVFYKYFYQTEMRDLGAILKEIRAANETYTDAANRDLARRIEDGIVRPESWTFTRWDPQNAEQFFYAQQQGTADPQTEQKLARARERLEALAAQREREDIVNERGAIRADIWRFSRPSTALQVIWIPLLMLGVAAAWFVAMALRDLRRRRAPLAETLPAMRRNWHGYAFVLPGMLAIFAFAIYPSLYQFYLAAHSGDGLGPMRYVGWENFSRILNVASRDFDSVFWTTVVPNTLGYMLVVTVGQITIGLLVASLLNLPLRANRVYRVLFFIPLVTSLAIVSVILIGLLKGPDSGLNDLLGLLHLQVLDDAGKPIDWLGKDLGLFTIMGVGIWHGLPYTIILLLAGLQSISPDLYEAAKIDGAGAWKRFWHVTIPGILPILIIIAFNAFIGAARAFSVAFVLTEGGIDHSSELVATYIFKWGFMKTETREPNLGYASALGIVYSLMLMALTFTNVMIIARRWKRRLATERAANRPATPTNA
jgi:ABC-type sugar transport system permease subunit/ABC-type glycerol-3-phosphate transport system substrate-binding protein